MISERELLLTPDELCTWLKLKPSWLYQRIHSRRLPFSYIKVGKYIRFPESAILEYLKKQAEGGQQ